MTQGEPLLAAEALVKHFGPVQAVRGASFELKAGRTFGIVGESGSGKSTTARLVLHLLTPTSGRVRFRGQLLDTLSKSALRRERRHMQMVFQDPYSSLNPRMTVGDTLTEPMEVHGLQGGRARAVALLDEVGLPRTALDRYPHEFSGGQRQRIAIARALATVPALIVADEPVSALDVSVQAQVLNLLRDLQDRHGTALLFISHDLRVVQFMCDEIAVMYLGEIVEQGPREAIYATPRHPYTQALLDSAPGQVRRLPPLRGDIPSPAAVPSGCAFRTRCPLAFDRCAAEHPALRPVGHGHAAACHLAAHIP